MALTETVIEGTIQADGTLLLDQKPNLIPGRVTVVLRQESEAITRGDDPFWLRMQAIWDAQTAAGHQPPQAAEVDARIRELRQGSYERQEEIERNQKESHRARRLAGEANP